MTQVVKRFFGKKRGQRNMRSDRIGGAWWTFFALVFCLTGVVGLWLIVSRVILPEWRANQEFKETTCRLLAKRLLVQQTEDGTTYRPDLRIEYDVDGRVLQTWTYDATQVYTSGRDKHQQMLDGLEIGGHYRCWYDPLDPKQVVVVRGYSYYIWLMLLVPAAFIVFGLTGLVYFFLHWGKSAERRAVLAQRAKQILPFDPTKAHEQLFPQVPNSDHVTNSPGTTLAYRLPNDPTGWNLFGIGLFSALWIGGGILWGGLINQPLVEDWGDYLLIGVWLCGAGLGLFLFVQQLLIATGVSPTIVEIDRHPLHPGESCELFILQDGRLTLNQLRVVLVCEEEATFQQGTNVRTERQRVFESELMRSRDLTIQPREPLDIRLTLSVPEQAMHSFVSVHNKVIWRLIVEGDVARWPNFQRAYVLTVFPVASGDDPS